MAERLRSRWGIRLVLIGLILVAIGLVALALLLLSVEEPTRPPTSEDFDWGTDVVPVASIVTSFITAVAGLITAWTGVIVARREAPTPGTRAVAEPEDEH